MESDSQSVHYSKSKDSVICDYQKLNDSFKFNHFDSLINNSAFQPFYGHKHDSRKGVNKSLTKNHLKMSHSLYHLYLTQPPDHQNVQSNYNHLADSKNGSLEQHLSTSHSNDEGLTSAKNKTRSESSSPSKNKSSSIRVIEPNDEPPALLPNKHNSSFFPLDQKITMLHNRGNNYSLEGKNGMSHLVNCKTIDSLKENLHSSNNKLKTNCVKRRPSDLVYDRFSNPKPESYYISNITSRTIRSSSNVFGSKVQSFRSRSGPPSPDHATNDHSVQKEASALFKIRKSVEHLPAMDLIRIGSRRLWCEVPQVQELGLLRELSSAQRHLQEAMFEVITSEASYLKSLDILVNHFSYNIVLSNSVFLDPLKREGLFSNILEVRNVSYKLMHILELRWKQNVILTDIADILLDFATHHFSPFITYCRYKKRQEKALKELQLLSKFNEVLKQIESQPICQGLTLHSYLLLPMQRVTRYPLLIEAILKRLSSKSSRYLTCKKAFLVTNRLVAECNNAANQYDQYLDLSTRLKFSNVKAFSLSHSRWLIKSFDLIRIKPEYQSSILISSFRVPHWSKFQTVISILSDMLVLSKKKR